MTDATAPQTPAQTAPATPTPPPAPAIDMKALAAEAAKSASDAAIAAIEKKSQEMVAAKMKAAAQMLTGESEPPRPSPLKEAWEKDPTVVARSIVDVAKAEMAKESREEAAKRDAFRATQQNVARPFIEEYPEINTPTKLALVEKLTEKHESSGIPYADALKKGFEEAVKEFGLQSVTEATNSGAVRNSGLPFGGAITAAQRKFSEEKSASDFLTRQKERATSFRIRAA